MSIDKIKASRAIRKAKPLGRYALGGEPEPPMVPGGATANLDLPKEDRVTAAMREGWGEGDLGLSEESRRWLIEHGVYPSSAKDPSLLKRINRGVIESIEPVGEAALRGSNAVLHGVANVAGGYYDKLPLPSFIRNNLGTGAQLERDLVDMPNAFMASVPGGYIDAVNTTKAARGLERAGLRAGERGGINLGPKGDVLGMGVGGAKIGNDPIIDAYNQATWLDGSHPGKVSHIDEFDFTFPNGVSAALGEELKKIPGLRVHDDFASEGNSLYREVELPNGEPLKIRVSDHANMSASRNPADFNLAPGGSHNFEDVAPDLQKRIADAWEEVSAILKNDPDSWDVPEWAIKEFKDMNSGLGLVKNPSKAGLGPKGDVLGMGVSGESKPPIPVGAKKNIYDFDARLAAKEEAEERPFIEYGSRLQGESLANTQIKATPYKDEEIKRFLHLNIFDNPKIDHYKLGQHTGAVKSWLEHPNAQQFVNMPDQMIENYVNSMKKAENRLFNDGDLSQNAIDPTRRNSKVRKEAITLREQYNQMRERIGLQPWDTVKADDAYAGYKTGDMNPSAWIQGWDYAKKSAANMAEKSVTSNDLINMTAMARTIPKPINKSRGGAVHQRALGAKLFGLK